MFTMTQPQKDALDRYLTTPPAEENTECPECGAEVEQHDDGWRCTNEDCDWSSYPDYEEADDEMC